MTWPITAHATVHAIAALGMTTALRSIAMKGMVACTARNHSGLNLRTCTRAAPDGKLAAPVKAPMAASFTGSARGRSSRTGLSRATAARAATIADGHFRSRALAAAASAPSRLARPLLAKPPPRKRPPLRSLAALNLPLPLPRARPAPAPRNLLPEDLPAAGPLPRPCCVPLLEACWLDAGRCFLGFCWPGLRCACARHQSSKPDCEGASSDTVSATCRLASQLQGSSRQEARDAVISDCELCEIERAHRQAKG